MVTQRKRPRTKTEDIQTSTKSKNCITINSSLFPSSLIFLIHRQCRQPHPSSSSMFHRLLKMLSAYDLVRGSSINDVKQFWKLANPLDSSSHILVLSIYYFRHKILDPSPSDHDVILGKP